MDWLTWHDAIKWLHVIGACVLLGTGAGIAFFMVFAHRTRNAVLIAHVAGTVVIADMLFTATAAILQPVTGVLLMRAVGWSISEPWVIWSLALYAFIGLFWLPVVWMQLRMKALAQDAADHDKPLPASYFQLYRLWFAFGVPAFAAILVIIWLMVAKPTIG